MAQTGFTPIQLYSSSTTGNTPAAADLLNSSGGSELAINIFDGKLFYKDSSGNVQVIGWKVVPVSAGGTGQTSYTDGQLLIGNSTGNTLTKATLTAGTGITITNGSGAITINGTGGTVTSVAALTLGTAGTDLSSTVANGTTTPVITLNVPTASATNRGALSAADWTTFNNKQPAGTYVTNLTGPITSVGNATSIASQTGTGTTFAMSASPTFTGTVGAADLTTTGNTILGNASTDTLNVGNGDLVKDASGNLGLGVTPSAWNTNVKAAQLASGSLYSYSTVDLELTQNCYYNTSNQWIYSTTAPAERYSMYNGQHQWYTAPSGTAGNAITFTQAMTLDASGNVGVGVTPNTWYTNRNSVLSFGGAGNVATLNFAKGTCETLFNAYFNAAGNAIYQQTNYAGYNDFNNTEDGGWAWKTAPSGTAGNTATLTTRMTLGNTGNLTATGYFTSTAVESFRVLADKEISFGSNTASLGIGQYFASGTTSLTWYYRTGGATLMALTTGGNLTISGATATKASGTTWANPSDIRLKENVTDYSKGLAELMQVNVKEWTYNGKGGTTEGMKGLGVIADEIMIVLPNTVENYQAKLNADDEADTDIKKFDATEITWLMLNSIKEQQKLITSLIARLDALEG